jgi:hypothetical protein
LSGLLVSGTARWGAQFAGPRETQSTTLREVRAPRESPWYAVPVILHTQRRFTARSGKPQTQLA